jgi:hypothetical protein
LLVIAVVAGYTVALVAVLGGGGGGTKTRTVVQGGRQRPLTPLERKVKNDVVTASLFQNENTDVPYFRRPQVASIRCQDKACRVIYSVAVPGRGRILFQQLNMTRAIFHNTDVDKVVLRVVRVEPTGPNAIHKSEEETPAGFPLLESTCLRSKAQELVSGRTQKQTQAAVSNACDVKAFDQGQFHGGRGGQLQGPG